MIIASKFSHLDNTLILYEPDETITEIIVNRGIGEFLKVDPLHA